MTSTKSLLLSTFFLLWNFFFEIEMYFLIFSGEKSRHGNFFFFLRLWLIFFFFFLKILSRRGLSRPFTFVTPKRALRLKTKKKIVSFIASSVQKKKEGGNRWSSTDVPRWSRKEKKEGGDPEKIIENIFYFKSPPCEVQKRARGSVERERQVRQCFYFFFLN